LIRPLLALAILVPAATFAQTKFEMADVHVSPPTTKQPDGGFMPGGRVELRGFSMLALISMAYDVEPANILEGPGSMSTASTSSPKLLRVLPPKKSCRGCSRSYWKNGSG
jgi:hypothetical protein